jgi:hypothetical protein
MTDQDSINGYTDHDGELPPEQLAPRADDTDAEADVARPSRVMQHRVQRRSQFSMAPPALLLVAVGVLFLSHTLTPGSTLLTPLTATGAALGALGLGLVFRFVINGRRETGVLVVGLVLLLWLGLLVLGAMNVLDLTQAYPLFLSAIGVAIFVMLPFVRERGLLLPALSLMVMGIALLPFTTGTFRSDLLPTFAAWSPLLLVLLGLVFLPRAFRSRDR